MNELGIKLNKYIYNELLKDTENGNSGSTLIGEIRKQQIAGLPDWNLPLLDAAILENCRAGYAKKTVHGYKFIKQYVE